MERILLMYFDMYDNKSQRPMLQAVCIFQCNMRLLTNSSEIGAGFHYVLYFVLMHTERSNSSYPTSTVFLIRLFLLDSSQMLQTEKMLLHMHGALFLLYTTLKNIRHPRA